jgi:hypothetical protein
MELVVNFGLMKRKVLGVIDVDDLFVERVGIVTFSSFQFKSSFCGNLHNGWVGGVVGTTRQSHETAVFRTAIIRIDAV